MPSLGFQYRSSWLTRSPTKLRNRTRQDAFSSYAVRRTTDMARRSSLSASKDVKSAMRRRKRGTLKSGGSGKTVKSRKQAIAIGLSEARKKGKKVPSSARRNNAHAVALLKEAR
jgi:hypothetical protein